MGIDTQTGRGTAVEGLEEPTLGSCGGDVLTPWTLAPVPHNKSVGTLTQGFVSSREDRRQRKIRRVEDRRPLAKTQRELAALRRAKQAKGTGTAQAS